MRPIRTEADIDDLLRGAKALAVISAWNERGLFDALAEGPRTVAELAAQADRRAVEITIPVLLHLGLLVSHGDRVALSEAAARMRAEGALPTAHNFEMLRHQSRMGEVLARGGPVRDDEGEPQVTDGGVRVDDPEASARFLDRLYEGSTRSARQVFEWLAPELPEGARVLDVGGGHGRYARTFAEAGHHAVIFDFPHVVDYARGRHGEALGYLAGNFRDADADFGGPHDLVFLSNIVHGEPDAENRSLIARLARTLAPGGWLVLKDMFLDEHGRDPENAVFFGLTMLYYTRAGHSPTVAQARSWLEDAGLGDVTLSVADRFQLLRAKR